MRYIITVALLFTGTAVLADPAAFKEDLAAIRKAGTGLHLIDAARPDSCPSGVLLPAPGDVFIPEGEQPASPRRSLSWNVVDERVEIAVTVDGTLASITRFRATRTGDADGLYYLDFSAACKDVDGARICTDYGPDDGVDMIVAMADPCAAQKDADARATDRAMMEMVTAAMAMGQPLYLSVDAADICQEFSVSWLEEDVLLQSRSQGAYVVTGMDQGRPILTRDIFVRANEDHRLDYASLDRIDGDTIRVLPDRICPVAALEEECVPVTNPEPWQIIHLSLRNICQP